MDAGCGVFEGGEGFDGGALDEGVVIVECVQDGGGDELWLLGLCEALEQEAFVCGVGLALELLGEEGGESWGGGAKGAQGLDGGVARPPVGVLEVLLQRQKGVLTEARDGLDGVVAPCLVSICDGIGELLDLAAVGGCSLLACEACRGTSEQGGRAYKED